MKISKDLALDMAFSIARLGDCLKRNYGCVIVYDDNYVVSSGYTMSAQPCKKCKRRFCRKGHGYDKCPSVHAEQAALVGVKVPPGSVAYLACVDDSTDTEVTNPHPCPTCTKLLRYAGIEKVITRTEVIEL